MEKCKVLASATKDNSDSLTDVSRERPSSRHEGGRSNSEESYKQKLRVCRFYMTSTCRLGEECRFYHPKRRSKPPKITREPDEKPVPPVGIHPRKAPSDLNFGMFMKPTVKSRPPVVRPESVKRGTSDGLLQVELEQLIARFPGGKSKLIEKGKHGVVYRITFTPTDPDWIFAFKNVDLVVDIPAEYPVTPLRVVVPDDQNIPRECVVNINSAISEWSRSFVPGSLMLRPLLHWLDRVITMLVKDSLAENAAVQDIDSDTSENDKAEVLDEELQSGDENEHPEEDDKKLLPSDNHKESQSGDDNKTLQTELGKKQGTEVRLKDLMLGQSVATVVFSNVKLVVECTRCKFSQDITVIAEKPMSCECRRCHACLSALYHPCLVHANSITMGYMDLLGCVAADAVLMDSNVSIICLECGRENATKGFCYGQSTNVFCRRCHFKLTLYAEQCKFVQHQQRVLNLVAHQVEKPLKRKQKEPSFKVGTSLPENGVCQHYKKSHRWLRFPCCGKAYPCDICHDSKEDHPMERANRMICGFCSQEQVYTTSKPCTLCGYSLAVVKHSAFWEGGLGCRNKTKMSRNDKKKFSQSSEKTTSKHLERVGIKGKNNRKH